MENGNSIEALFLKRWRPYAWFVSIGILLYFKTLFFEYTFLDDNVLISANYDFLRSIANIPNAFFRQAFSHGFLPYYRPMLLVSFILDAQIGGITLLVYHITNISIHLFNACLLFILLMKLRYARQTAFIFSLIFTVHPVLTQAVAWVPGRNDSMLALFLFLSFIFFLEFLEKKRMRSYIWHILALVLALFTKESAVILIPVCFLYLHLIEKERFLSMNEKAFLLGWGGAIGLWIIFRNIALKNSVEFTIFDVGNLLIIYMPVLIQFLGKMLMPFNLSVFPTMEDTTFVYGAITIALLIFALVFTKNRRYNYIIFGASWLILFLLPSLVRANASISVDFLEHRVYVALAGFIIVLAETDVVKKFRIGKAGALISAALVISLFFAITSAYSENFRDRLKFWEDAVRHAPHSPFAHLALGITYHTKARFDEAGAQYVECLKLDPQQPMALCNLGDIYLKKNRLEKAERELKKALAIYPESDVAYLQLGVVYYRKGRMEEAEEAWKRSLELNPEGVDALKNLAIYYYEQKDFPKSVYYVRKLQKLGATPPKDFLEAIGIVQ